MNRTTLKLFVCCTLMLGSINLSATAQTGLAEEEVAGAPGEYPGVEKFAEQVTGTIWDLRGTHSLKHLRYNGATWHSLNSRDAEGSAYDSAFVDVGVVRFDFRGPNTGWYFFSDDLKWVTPLTVGGELVFTLAEGATAKPVKNFPADIEAVVWDLQPDERGLPPMKLRWNGRELEIGVDQGGEWATEKLPAVVANRRVLEVDPGDGSAVWYAFSADGREAWMLQLNDVYGGHARSVTRGDESASTPQGMKAQHIDEFHHALQLKAAGEAGRMATVKRYLLRKYAANRAVSDAIERALQ